MFLESVIFVVIEDVIGILIVGIYVFRNRKLFLLTSVEFIRLLSILFLLSREPKLYLTDFFSVCIPLFTIFIISIEFFNYFLFGDLLYFSN